MANYGYARVSTSDQSTELQEKALFSAGCEIVRSENVSGTSRVGRTELDTLLQFLRKGDVLVVTRLDRLARSLLDLSQIVAEIEKKGCFLRVLEQPVDMTTSAGRAFVGMLGVFAQFETDLRRERQMEGIAKAKAEGRYKGKQANPDSMADILHLKAQGLGATEIAKRVGCTRQNVYKVLARQGDLLKTA